MPQYQPDDTMPQTDDVLTDDGQTDDGTYEISMDSLKYLRHMVHQKMRNRNRGQYILAFSYFL